MSQDLVAQALNALQRKDYAQALDIISIFCAQHTSLNRQHYLIKGLSEIALEHWQSARNTFYRAVQELPSDCQLWFNLGIAQEKLGEIQKARISFEECLHLDPNMGDAYGNLSNIYRKIGLFNDAESVALKACQFASSKSLALNSLGLALSKQGKYLQAHEVFQQALEIDPTHADILGNLANLCIYQLKFQEAWNFFSKAREQKDAAIFRRDEGMGRLLSGDYKNGLTLYESRLELPSALRQISSCPIYRGGSLMGKKLLLIAEQGLGDTLMFCRYGKYLSEQGANLFWVVPPPLKNLLQDQVPGIVIADTEEFPESDFYLPLLSLPYTLQKLEISTLSSQPYLKSPSIQIPISQKSDKKRIGIAWSGSPTHERDHERSLSLKQFYPLWNNIDADYYALSMGPALTELRPDMPLKRIDQYLHDYTDTAAWIKEMDFIISVDTSVAHLAGALGVKTYLLLSHCPDWRWGSSGTISPWYPNMCLIRQPSYGNWDSVITKLVETLQSPSV